MEMVQESSGAIQSSRQRRAAHTEIDRLPALDGIRAVAIALVLIGHILYAFGPFRNGGTLVGEAGVTIFFVLSGFLVTRVMLLDEARTGRLRLGRFYCRRALRIFPAFYAFLIVSFVLSVFGAFEQPDRKTWLASALYFRNLAGDGWNTGHLWSLSLEEQFYFFWPAIFLLLAGRKRRLLFIGAAVVAATAGRLAWIASLSSPLPPFAIQQIHYTPQFRMDTFLIGAAFAIANWEWTRALEPRFIIPFLAIWFETAPFHRATLPVDTAVTAFGVGALILWLVQNPQLRPAFHLSRPAVVYLGAISYSLYLWQQLFLGPHLRWWSLAAVAVCAICSYHLIERPFLRWKERLQVPPPATRIPSDPGIFSSRHPALSVTGHLPMAT